jgi:predicted metal-dependent hydrolase
MEPAEPIEPIKTVAPVDSAESTADDLPTAEFLKGIEEFNARQFFECHETLEAVWKVESSPRREFTQGVIQTAVAFYHLERDNQVGAIKLFHRALPRLRKFGPSCYGVDACALAQAVDDALSLLESYEPDGKQTLPVPPQIEMSAHDKLLNH